MSAIHLHESPSRGHAASSILQSVRAEGSVHGLLFELSVEQHYLNASDDNVEAVYTFPVPWNAVLLGVECVLGEKTLQGTVVARAEGERIYERALEDGNAAVMVERAADGMYTVNVGNLLPRERAVVRFRYAQLLSFTQGQVRLVVPTVIAPRYGDPRSAGLQPHQVPATDLCAAYPFSLSVSFHGELASAKLSSPSHVVSVRSSDGNIQLALRGDACLDRDVVFLAEGLAGKSLSALGRDGDGIVALASFCPSDEGLPATTSLNLKILVDCSGSMNGERIAAARRALHEVLSHLEPEDSFSLSCFGSEVMHLSDSLITAMPRAIRKASGWVAAIQADMGGTEIREALLSTFALAQPFDADVLLITDGDIWDTERLVASAQTAGQRVFAVGIGSAPQSSLLHALAGQTGGACEFVAGPTELQGAILRTFRRMRQAPVRDVTVRWEGDALWQTRPGRVVLSSETVHHFAGFAGAAPAGATLAWREDGQDAPRAVRVLVAGVLADGDTLARLAAAARMEGAPAAQQHALALEYGLVSRTTSLVLVHQREDTNKPAELPQLRSVSQMAPAGWAGHGMVKAGAFDTPAMWRREATHLMVTQQPAHYDIPVFRRADTLEDMLRQVDAAYLHRASLRSLAENLDTEDKGQPAPATLDDLAAALPAQLFDELCDELRQLVDAGHAEEDVVRAFLVAVADCFREHGIAQSMLGVLRRTCGRLVRHPAAQLERRVSTLVRLVFEARRPGAQPYDIPAFLRRQAD